ncbi:hypothetical protein [Aneurinibacillus migulanus]|uniref:Uncharacterized protein n=1 Tax=Aneurinibacillus migulanus TaxID=47500 RepID=A0A0D1WI94_ANEMI|nr:hypothetical protein [Aneurinibacillus migulanus]KIV58295.1 hypothetical protein TS65_06885 [Aneurinibacillus migulanus]KON95977.1 hypothetical protein AF333_11240 [Aneurinibacillus migulanus]MCP1358731.1 hypothetical protein [Aneurinibacillus migulanus]MED0896537.1 hypothetical protein [Aneurinibacillus migulanus]MED1616522.1 hypothetical protein [Aneurinibacillus migulanus]
MNLSCGITGFYDVKHKQPPGINGNEFKKICHSVAMITNGKMVHYKEPSETITSFYEAKLTVIDKEIYVLLNAYYPILAFASSVEYFNIMFIDEPSLVEHFSLYYNVISSDELNEPLLYKEKGGNLIIRNKNNLNNAELEQIRYWQPQTVGKVAFNFWD